VQGTTSAWFAYNEGPKKPALIEAMCEYDAKNVQHDDNVVETAEVVDDDGEFVNDSAAEVNITTESEQIKALKLQLEIACINLLQSTGFIDM
jgi:hypothetical protein